MNLGLNWLAKSLALNLVVSLTLIGLINCSFSSDSLNVVGAKAFEDCVSASLSQYPFISKKDLKKFKKLVREINYHLRKDPSQVVDGRYIDEKLTDLMTIDDSWGEYREELYLSALGECSLLVSGNPENELLKEVLTFSPSSDRYEKHLGSSTSKRSKSDSEPKARKKRAAFAFASSSAGGQGNYRIGNSAESVIRGSLINSNVFTKVFHTGLLKKDAKLISDDITKAGLYGYNVPLIDEAVVAVNNNLEFTSLNTNTQNYAFLLARSIAAVLERYQLLLQANGNQIANNMIREIQKLLGDQSTNTQAQAPVNNPQNRQVFEAGKDSAVAQTSGNNQRQNFNLSPPIQPSPVLRPYPEDKFAVFRNKLTSLLAESRELNDLFCKGSAPNVFQTIKSALSDYGLKISVSAAALATSEFTKLNSQQSCSQYPNILSEIIRDALFDNGSLESAKPEDIAVKVVSSANAFSNPPSSPQPEMPKENFKSSMPLLPSFPEVSFQPNDKKEEFYDNAGAMQRSVLNPSTQVYPEDWERGQNSEPRPPPLSESKPSPPVKFYSEPSFRSVEQLTKESSSGNTEQSYDATTPLHASQQSNTDMFSNPSTAQYGLMPTTTIAPEVSTTEKVSDLTAHEFMNAFMSAFDMSPSASRSNDKDFDDVVGDPEKLSGLLEKEMESLSRSGSPEEKEHKAESLALSKNKENKDKTQTSSKGQSKPLAEDRNKQINPQVSVAATSSQSKLDAGDPPKNIESGFTPTPAALSKQETQEHKKRKSDFLKKVSDISTTGIALIRSPSKLNLQELCSNLNRFAVLVGIEPIPDGNCEKIPLIDYLLHVIKEVASKMEKD